MFLFKPLLLHPSSPTSALGHRRVIHIDYAANPLPGGLNWYWAVRQGCRFVSENGWSAGVAAL